MVKIHLQCRRSGFNPLVGRISWRWEQLPTPVFWPGESIDRRAWQATGHGFAKSWTWLSDFHFQIKGRNLGEGQRNLYDEPQDDSSSHWVMRVPEIIISLEDTRLQSMWYLSQWYLCFDLTSDRRVRDFWTESQALPSKTGKAFTSSRDVQFPEITLSLCVRLTSKLILYLWFESLTSWGLLVAQKVKNLPVKKKKRICL